jgi:hypothetical protein
MGPVEAELDERITTLSDPRVVWVRRLPYSYSYEEACLIFGPRMGNVVCTSYMGDERMPIYPTIYHMSHEAMVVVGGVVEEISDGRFSWRSVGNWNDHQENREAVIAVLEKARSRAGELGI